MGKHEKYLKEFEEGLRAAQARQVEKLIPEGPSETPFVYQNGILYCRAPLDQPQGLAPNVPLYKPIPRPTLPTAQLESFSPPIPSPQLIDPIAPKIDLYDVVSSPINPPIPSLPAAIIQNLGDKISPEEEESRELKELKLKLINAKKKKLQTLSLELQEKECLPHRHGRKLFQWQREFFESTDKDLFLTSGNQLGKSCISISTCIEWAGNKSLWPKLWPGRTPRQFWYLYPSSQLAMSEFKTKWEPDLLPRGAYKTSHPDWGWRMEQIGNTLTAIHFNSGVSVYFKYYTQDIFNLQASTIAAAFCDEELVSTFWDEINFRRMNYQGYFRMVFTATRGERLWFQTMECQGTKEEKFPHAKKMQISMYDCRKFEDGSPSHITDEYIKRAIALCKSEAEVQKRVMGRFAIEGGLKYMSFDRKKHIIPEKTIPKNWPIYVGIDIGAGGDENHPSTIQFVAVNPEYTEALCFDAWIGSEKQTVHTEVYEQLIKMLIKHDVYENVAGILYDHNAKDFAIICERKGLSMIKAEKSHDIGESVINVLFKNDRLKIFDIEEHEELIYELTNLKKETLKRMARDDAADALRYAITRIPFNWEKIGVEGIAHNTLTKVTQALNTPEEELNKQRRSGLHTKEESFTIEQELTAWGELYDY